MLKKGFIYYLLSSLFIALLFLFYIQGNNITSQIDTCGWIFFVTSCIGHAAILVLALFLVFYVPWALLRLKKLSAALFVTAVSLLAMLVFVNMQVFKIYRFHINGFIINMLTGPNPGDIFQFDTAVFLTEGAMLLGVVACCVLLWFCAKWLAARCQRKFYVWSIVSMLAILLTANGLYCYGAFVVKPSILLSSKLVPYYFPLSMSSKLEKMGFKRKTVDINDGNFGDDVLHYPIHPLSAKNDTVHTNIVMILIDSWNKRALTQECMPNIKQMAEEEQFYDNHVSSSNGTRYSVFSIITGLQPYYWPSFEGSHSDPLLIKQLVEQGYDFHFYPSATLKSPPLAGTLFKLVPNLRSETPGDSPYERDCRIASDFVKDMPAIAKKNQPFFAFIFFDMPHGLSYPTDKPQYFKPAWNSVNYALLNNDTPVEPFWNLYLNLCHATDSLVGEVTAQLKENGLYENTLVILTGDHGQEFNENHKNYWGHGSNFSQHQVAVPLIMHVPGKEPSRHTHRTTHYDFVPTLMHDYLGVQNPLEDYCAGRLLDDTTPRLWHFVGNDLRYAFLLEKDTILTKEGAGWIETTDSRLNPIKDYHINPRKFEEAITNLNRFFK